MSDLLTWLWEIPFTESIYEITGRVQETVSGDQTARTFAGVVVIWFVVALISHPLQWILQWGRRATRIPGQDRLIAILAHFVAITPGSLTIIGVLGTFTGIFIGLLDFDVEKIDDSIPALLEGLKTAFVTSIVGMAAGLAFRFVNSVLPSIEAESASVTPGDIHRALIDIREDNRRQAKDQNERLETLHGAIAGDGDSSLHAQMLKLRTDITERLETLHGAIAGDGDSSLHTQILKLRTTISDGQKELIEEFRAFAEHMVQNTHKALIEALEQVIREFNKNLTEQFGENFKQLNEAVHKLVEWQDKYREHVEAMQARLDAAVGSIENTEKAVAAIVGHTEAIPKTMELVAPILEGINTQAEALGDQLKAIAELRDKAVEAFPVIEGNLEQLTSSLKENVDAVTKQSAEAVAEGRKAQQEYSEAVSAVIANTKEAQQEFSNGIERAMGEMTAMVEKTASNSSEIINKAMQGAQEAIETQIRTLSEETRKQSAEYGKIVDEALKKAQESISAQMKTLDDAMQQELGRALQIMGQKLASLSETFVKDYTPLTQRLREIVEIAEKAERVE